MVSTHSLISLSTVGWAVLIISFISWKIIFCSFENATDLKFFLGFSLPWRVWKWKMMKGDKEYTTRTYQVENNCTNLGLVYAAQHPILFKNCINPRLSTVDDFLFFENEIQNLFPPCEGKILNHFTFESFANETKAFAEDIPCNNFTLNEKISAFRAHELHPSPSDHDEKGEEKMNSYQDVHPYVPRANERQNVNKVLSRNVLIDNFDDVGLSSKMVMPILLYYLYAGKTSAYYLHAHMDHFLSFGLTGTKTWTVIDPYYLDDFNSLWSGNALVMIKETTNTPKITIMQEKGDILFIPPWWLHETMVHDTKKNVGFNIHFGIRGQFVVEIAELALKYIGNTHFFSNIFSRYFMAPDKN